MGAEVTKNNNYIVFVALEIMVCPFICTTAPLCMSQPQGLKCSLNKTVSRNCQESLNGNLPFSDSRQFLGTFKDVAGVLPTLPTWTEESGAALGEETFLHLEQFFCTQQAPKPGTLRWGSF